MSSSDTQYAYATLKPLIIALACETGFYVLSILTFVVPTYILAWVAPLKRAYDDHLTPSKPEGFQNKSNSHLWIGDMNQIQTELSGGFIEIAEVVTTYVDIYLPIINYSLSDGIVLWRVWIMWGRRVKVLIFTVLFSLASIVGAGMFIGFGGLDIGLVATFISTLATNIIATTLIVVKAWQHRRLIRSHLNDTEYRSQAMSILVLLIESGTLYCVIWIIFLVTWCSVDGTFDMYDASVYEILPGIAVQVSGIYPTAVIALAALQKTTWDMSAGNDMSQNAPHAEMRFVTIATRSGVSTADIGSHHLTPSIDQGSHPHASEIAARDGEV